MNENTSKPWDWLPIPAPHQQAFAQRGAWNLRTLADLARERAASDPEDRKAHV